MTTPRKNSIVDMVADHYCGLTVDEVLGEEYLGLGTTGKIAIQALWDDFAEGRMDGWLEETGTTQTELLNAMVRFTSDIVTNGEIDAVRTPEGWRKKCL